MKFIQYSLVLLVSLSLISCSKPSSTENSKVVDKQTAYVLDVFKTPTCGCCGVWVDHLDDKGFKTTVFDQDSIIQKKDALGVPDRLRSCHTGVSQNGYFFEGHIPAKFIKQFLDNPPSDALGLTVPGMPAGSPGMEMGQRFDPYAIMLVKKNGEVEVYAEVKFLNEQYDAVKDEVDG